MSEFITKRRVVAGATAAALATVVGAGIAFKRNDDPNEANHHTERTVVCGRGTHFENLTYDQTGSITGGINRVSYLVLPGDRHVKLYDPTHQADSLYGGDRTDLADRNSDAVFGLEGVYKLGYTGSEISSVSLTTPLGDAAVNAACGSTVRITINQ